MNKIPMLNVARQTVAIRSEIEAAVARVLDHGRFIQGPEVAELEERIADLAGTRHAVACASGTDALLLPLMALQIGPGHRVVTTPFTFFATAGSIARVGATPVFVDIDPLTYNMDPDALERCLASLDAADIQNVKAILPVHLFGQCARMDRIMQIAHWYGIPVIEDAAQAIGATAGGRQAGTIGLCGTLSFFPSKNLGCAGDGGMVLTNDSGFAETLRLLRGHGAERQYYHRLVGTNSRLDTLQAAILLAKFGHLEEWTRRRRDNAEYYASRLAGSGLNAPYVAPGGTHVFNQFTIRVPNRDSVRQRMDARGVATAIYYPVPLHLQECFASLGYKQGDLPASEQAASEVLSIPIDPELTPEEREIVVEALLASV